MQTMSNGFVLALPSCIFVARLDSVILKLMEQLLTGLETENRLDGAGSRLALEKDYAH
jgi:hypothetical protein